MYKTLKAIKKGLGDKTFQKIGGFDSWVRISMSSVASCTFEKWNLEKEVVD